jgi:4-hydroxy-tetrahydrodipicolinate synthase
VAKKRNAREPKPLRANQEVDVKGLERIDGVVPVIPTPFTANEEVDWRALRGLVAFAGKCGVPAICLPAYASEFYKLTVPERQRMVEEALDESRGRIPVIAQVNYPSAAQAAENARFAQTTGADAVCISVPRLFALPEADLMRYFDRVLDRIEIPVMIQDFNPGGPTVSPAFAAELHRRHPHFRFLKLEEPMMAAKVEAVLDATRGGVGVLEGWGGMYLLELIPAGICGVMPGLALADLLSRVYMLAARRQMAEAYGIFAEVLPQIVFSLQNLELFHHAEKMLLVARGVLPEAHVRDAGMRLRPAEAAHIGFLNGRILALLDRLGLPAKQ